MTPEAWATHIAESWTTAVTSILETGRRLQVAKAELGWGRWISLFGLGLTPVSKPLPFSLRTAQRLLAIAGHPVLADATHASLLPPHWPSLYSLSRLPPALLLQKIAAGEISSDMPRRAADQLRGHRKPTSEATSAAWSVDRFVDGIATAIETGLAACPRAELENALRRLATSVADLATRLPEAYPRISDSAADVLCRMREQAAAAEPGRRFVTRPNGATVWLSQGSTFPAWLDGAGFPRTSDGARRAQETIETLLDGVCGPPRAVTLARHAESIAARMARPYESVA